MGSSPILGTKKKDHALNGRVIVLHAICGGSIPSGPTKKWICNSAWFRVLHLQCKSREFKSLQIYNMKKEILNNFNPKDWDYDQFTNGFRNKFTGQWIYYTQYNGLCELFKSKNGNMA